MNLFTHSDFDNHERILFARDPASSLTTIVAVHSTALGPACGGCRMWPYIDEADAITDVLRLSRGMSYKNALAELPCGGGKAVIIGDPRTHKSPLLLRRFGDVVAEFGGSFVTAEDVGMTVADISTIAQSTRYVCGLPKVGTSAGGDPGPLTARGVYLGILSAVGFLFGEPGRDHLRGIRVAIQGLGSVGIHLCQYLHEAGAQLYVSDLNEERIDAARHRFGATPVSPDRILAVPTEVLAPCALGGVLNETSIPTLQCRIIAGAANNQLLTDTDGMRLSERGILYAPDYVINAGGIINVAHEYFRLGDAAATLKAIDAIAVRLWNLFEESSRSGEPTYIIANREAQRRLNDARSTRRAHVP